MIAKCLLLAVLAATVYCASLNARNIPVEIRYDRSQEDDLLPSKNTQKIEETVEQLKSVPDGIPDKVQYGVKNLDEKIQLSSLERIQAYKHLPNNKDSDLPLVIVEPDSNDKTIMLRNTNILNEKDEKSITNQDTFSAERLSWLERAHEVISSGLSNIKDNFKGEHINQKMPDSQSWELLDNNIKEFFLKEKEKLGLRQQGGDQQNFFQNLANGFQTITNNFIQNIQGSNSTGTEDEQQPSGPFQGFVGYFQGGVQNIVNTVNNLSGQGPTTSSTVLGDSGSTQAPGSGFISNIINNVQQFFQNQGNSTQASADTGTPNPGSGGGIFSGAINQFNQVVNNILPSSTAQPAVQGDEGTSSTASPVQGGPIQQAIQSFGSQIGTAINQFVSGGQSPQGSEDEGTQPQNQNFIQNIGQNIGSAFQNIQNQFRPGSSTQKPGEASGSDNLLANNPISTGIQNIQNQIQQFNNTNPIQSIQNAIQGGTDNNSGSNTDAQPVENQDNEQAQRIPEQQQEEQKVEENAENNKKEEIMTVSD